MKTVLEELWYSYLEDNDPKLSCEEKRLLEILVKSENGLREELNDKQIELLEDFTECWGELSSVCRKESFIKGVRFATQYLLEATQ